MKTHYKLKDSNIRVVIKMWKILDIKILRSCLEDIMQCLKLIAIILLKGLVIFSQGLRK